MSLMTLPTMAMRDLLKLPKVTHVNLRARALVAQFLLRTS